MPDFPATVHEDSPCPTGDTGHHWTHADDEGWRCCLRCGQRAWSADDVRDPYLVEAACSMTRDLNAPPDTRAVVAISEDRRWLVVLDLEPYSWLGDNQTYWSIYRWDSNSSQYEFETSEDVDTGQDAKDVLAEWLAEREETR